jgi:hypothetical protein
VHSTELPDDISAHHNGDYSGNVIFYLPGERVAVDRDGELASVSIPFKAIRRLVLDALRAERISRLESMTDEQLYELLKD